MISSAAVVAVVRAVDELAGRPGSDWSASVLGSDFAFDSEFDFGSDFDCWRWRVMERLEYCKTLVAVVVVAVRDRSKALEIPKIRRGTGTGSWTEIPCVRRKWHSSRDAPSSFSAWQKLLVLWCESSQRQIFYCAVTLKSNEGEWWKIRIRQELLFF